MRKSKVVGKPKWWTVCLWDSIRWAWCLGPERFITNWFEIVSLPIQSVVSSRTGRFVTGLDLRLVRWPWITKWKVSFLLDLSQTDLRPRKRLKFGMWSHTLSAMCCLFHFQICIFGKWVPKYIRNKEFPTEFGSMDCGEHKFLRLRKRSVPNKGKTKMTPFGMWRHRIDQGDWQPAWRRNEETLGWMHWSDDTMLQTFVVQPVILGGLRQITSPSCSWTISSIHQ